MRFFVAITVAASALFSTVIADSHSACACQIASDRGTDDAATEAMCKYIGGVTINAPTGALYPGKYCQGFQGHELGGDAVYSACRSQKCGETYCQDSTCV
ncbi:hypothetical protein MPH_02041 [Macrophomina phaseolina MS6]|uniref:Uncharacterized protein n=1 Tax=Macrophomina phaseolina (strain MS6) TaxID=1126212 RepID=K2RDS7_MACPH|nr:hypothetical protein MPH_02041 [Macrophomina phaseolina MS6]